ncbi:MAG: hypothetical protein V4476_26155 [Pseudomonadota bacterium]
MSLKIETSAPGDATPANSPVKKNGGGGDFGALLRHAATKQSDAAAELEKYVKMTPAERMAQAMLKKLGLTKEMFDALPPEQQAAITAKIADMIKQEMQAKAQNQGGSAAA